MSYGSKYTTSKPPDQYGIQADAFSRSIREDIPVPTDPRDAVANLEVMERIVADAGA